MRRIAAENRERCAARAMYYGWWTGPGWCTPLGCFGWLTLLGCFGWLTLLGSFGWFTLLGCFG